MKAIIQIDIPDHQIGQEVSIYFKDTMMIKGIVQESCGDAIRERMMGTQMKELDEMTVDELIELAKEIPVKIAIKQYGVGFKDGFNDGIRVEEDKKAICDTSRVFQNIYND